MYSRIVAASTCCSRRTVLKMTTGHQQLLRRPFHHGGGRSRSTTSSGSASFAPVLVVAACYLLQKGTYGEDRVDTKVAQLEAEKAPRPPRPPLAQRPPQNAEEVKAAMIAAKGNNKKKGRPSQIQQRLGATRPSSSPGQAAAVVAGQRHQQQQPKPNHCNKCEDNNNNGNNNNNSTSSTPTTFTMTRIDDKDREDLEHLLTKDERKKQQYLLKRLNEGLAEGTCLNPQNFKINSDNVSTNHTFSIEGHKEQPPQEAASLLLATASNKTKGKREQAKLYEQVADEEKDYLQRMAAIMQKQNGDDDESSHDYDNVADTNPPQGSVYDSDEESELNSTAIPSYIPSYKQDELGGSLSHHITHQSHPQAQHLLRNESQYPIEHAQLTVPPFVPPPINRQYPARVVVDLYSTNKKMKISGNKKFEYWPFGFYDMYERKFRFSVPGPFIRARVGDVLQVNFTNVDETGMAHSIDFHSVIGPGGGSPTNFAEQDETKVGAYLLQKPGLYVYHCAAAPIPLHIHNGMFGLILVEPTEGLPPVDREFYVMQSELYLQDADDDDDDNEYEVDFTAAEKELASHVVFNGKEGALVDKPIIVKQDETIRLFVGNGGPNLISSFHVIGGVFDRCYKEGDIVSSPAKYVQTTLVPAGGSTVVEMEMQVPGSYAIVDHSINRIDKGAVGLIKVKGKPRPDIYDSLEPPSYCPGCKTHQ